MSLFVRSRHALLALLPAIAGAQEFVAESPVKLALVASRTGEPVFAPKPGGKNRETASRLSCRITNADLLDLLVEDGLIPARAGWRVIGVWANWPDTGNGYRFFAQALANRSDVRAIPENRIAFEALTGAVARKHTLDGDSITAGNESFTIYARFGISDPDALGVLHGLLKGSGRYVKPKGAAQPIYAPRKSVFSGAGVLDGLLVDADDHLLEGTVTMHDASVAPASRYSLGAGSALGVSGSLQLSGSTLLQLGSLTGAVTLASGTLSVSPGATLGLSGSGVLKLGAGSTLVWTPGATFNFSTVEFAPGATLTQSGATVVAGSSLILTGAELGALDLAAPPPNLVLVDGVLSLAP